MPHSPCAEPGNVLGEMAQSPLGSDPMTWPIAAADAPASTSSSYRYAGVQIA